MVLTLNAVKVKDLEAMDEVELAKLCKRSRLHPGSNGKEELIKRIKEAKSKPSDQDKGFGGCALNTPSEE